MAVQARLSSPISPTLAVIGVEGELEVHDFTLELHRGFVRRGGARQRHGEF